MANSAKKAQLERARRIADEPERAERLKAREEMVGARNHRVAEREAARRAAKEREAAELAARQAAEAAARKAEGQAREEAQARRLAEQAKRKAAEAAAQRSDPLRSPGGPEKEKATWAVGTAIGRSAENSSMCDEVHTWSSPGPGIPSNQMSVFGQ